MLGSAGFHRGVALLGFLALPASRAPVLAACAWDEAAKLVAADAAMDEWFGVAVSNSGDTVVVGAHLDGSPISTGAAYVFERDAGGADNWGQTKKLRASDGAIGDAFGSTVSISGDTVVVGAHADDDLSADTGSAYVFERDAGGADNWGQVKKLTASDPIDEGDFGVSVAVSADTAVVGADDDDDGVTGGAAYVFERHAGGPGNWGQVKKLTAADASPGDFFGTSVSIDGDRIIVGAIGTDVSGTNSGSAYVFDRHAGGPGNWGQVKKLTAADAAAQDLFGSSLSVSGDTIVVGAYTDDSPLTDSGSAYVFERDAGGPGNWGQVKKLTAANAGAQDFFGKSISISGDKILVGANADDAPTTDSGSAFVFERDAGGPGNWGQVRQVTAADGSANDRFGTAVSIGGNTGVSGAVWDDPAGSASGSAYVFDCSDDSGVPGEASPSGDMLASRGVGTNIDVTFDPACAATGHAAYFGLGPITGTLQWTGSSCDLGTSGAASFDPGPVPPGDWLYYVIVGYNGLHEGSYGGRPEGVGVGACDRQEGTSTCEPQ